MSPLLKGGVHTRKQRGRYTKQFKIKAVQPAESREGTVSKVARNLGIHPNILSRWIRD